MKQDLRLLTEITLMALGVVVYGLIGTGVALALAALVGWFVGLAAGFTYVVLTMFACVKIDERIYRGP